MAVTLKIKFKGCDISYLNISLSTLFFSSLGLMIILTVVVLNTNFENVCFPTSVLRLIVFPFVYGLHGIYSDV